MASLQDSHAWLVVLAGIVMAGACVLLHYGVLSACNRHLPRLAGPPRRHVLVLVLAILVAHIAEIWVFGVGYRVLANDARFGDLAGLQSATLMDHVYFSAMIYSTVGLGDVVPVGAVRFVAAMEALLGFVLITWSASYTFLEMQRSWRRD
jgi:hypothetical protein